MNITTTSNQSTPTTTNKTISISSAPSVVDALGGSSQSHGRTNQDHTNTNDTTANRRHSCSTLFASNHTTSASHHGGHPLILSPLTQAKLTAATTNLVRNLALMECCQDQSKLLSSTNGHGSTTSNHGKTKTMRQLPTKDAGTIPPYKVQEFTKYFEQDNTRHTNTNHSNTNTSSEDLQRVIHDLQTQLAAQSAQVHDLQSQLTTKDEQLGQATVTIKELHRKLANDEHHLHHLEDTLVQHEQQHRTKVDRLVQELNQALQEPPPEQHDMISCSLLTTVQGLTRDLERREEQVEALETELGDAQHHAHAKIAALEQVVQAQQEQHALLNATALELVQLVHDAQHKQANNNTTTTTTTNGSSPHNTSLMHAMTNQHQRTVAKAARLEAACHHKDVRIASLEHQVQKLSMGIPTTATITTTTTTSNNPGVDDDLPVHEWVPECE